MYYNYFYNALYIKDLKYNLFFHNHFTDKMSLFEKSKLTFNRQSFVIY